MKSKKLDFKEILIITFIGVWIGQGAESLMLNLKFINYSYGEMIYNFIIAIILIAIYAKYINIKGEQTI